MHRTIPICFLLSSLSTSGPSAQNVTTAPPASRFEVPAVSDAVLRVDVFGYRPNAEKVAVVRQPVLGHDAPLAYQAPEELLVRRTVDGRIVHRGPLAAWNGGAVDPLSGDRVWWFDFSVVTAVGTYFLEDPENGARSEAFDISPDVYARAGRHALRMFLHQRCGVPKAGPSVDARWQDAACHLGVQQDTSCRSILDPSPTSALDLHGGWHDAGDFNKYVNIADDVVHDLLEAFWAAPGAWGDTVGLPESENGIPDLLDEVRHELEWFLRMQQPDGSVLHKVSTTGFSAASPASADVSQRFYAPPTASATVAACGAFAHAARAFVIFPDVEAQAFANELALAAWQAWSWLEANPQAVPSSYDNAGFSSTAAEDPAYVQEMNRLRAAVHLFALTGLPLFGSYVDGNYQQAHLFQWVWTSPWEHLAQGALLSYAGLPAATPSVAADIRTSYAAQVAGASQLGAAGNHAYRAHLPAADYTWGSNATLSLQSWLFGAMVRHGLVSAANAPLYDNVAAGYLHYLHGVNPQGLCYLTNMDAFGAGSSAREMYHAWFADGTVWDRADDPIGPPPGYVTGGVNPSYAPDPAYLGPPLIPPLGQPVLKSYRDWNADWPQNSWEISEPSIAYQGAYLLALSRYLP